jgi:hypothetical protein
MEGTELCGGSETPVLFANFTVKGVKPVHVFNAVADIVTQAEWSGDLKSAHVLKDDLALQARGVVSRYIAGPALSDRLVYEWHTYDRNEDGSEYWFAATTRNNDVLKDIDTTQPTGMVMPWDETTEANSCLSAHHMRATPDGVYVVFTNEVNGNPPLGIPQKMISSMTWGKTVSFIEALQAQAKKLASQDSDDLWKPPNSILLAEENIGQNTADCSPLWKDVSTAMSAQRVLEDKYDVQKGLRGSVAPRSVLSQPSLSTAAGLLLLFAAVSVFVAARRSQAPSSRDASRLLTVECVEESDLFDDA